MLSPALVKMQLDIFLFGLQVVNEQFFVNDSHNIKGFFLERLLHDLQLDFGNLRNRFGHFQKPN